MNAVNPILRSLNRNRQTRTGSRVISSCPADLRRRTADVTRTNLPCEQALGKMHVGGVRRARTADPPFFHPHPARARFGSADRQGTGIVSEPSRGNCDLGFRAAGGGCRERAIRVREPGPEVLLERQDRDACTSKQGFGRVVGRSLLRESRVGYSAGDVMASPIATREGIVEQQPSNADRRLRWAYPVPQELRTADVRSTILPVLWCTLSTRVSDVS
jgi:hypothetical protein